MKLFKQIKGFLSGNTSEQVQKKKLTQRERETNPALKHLPEHLLLKLRDGDESIMRYPPFTEGCPAWVPAEYLLKLHNDKLLMLKGGAGFNEADYERLIYPMLLNFADLVHMLPASQHHHHRGFGGLLRHGLEVSVNALSYAQCEVFDARDLPGRRDQRATVWRVAAIAAGLMHDAGKILTDLRVVSEDGASVWQPSIRTIPEWADLNGLDRYFLRWVPDRHESHKLQSLTLVERVIPVNLREWILKNGEDIYTDMTMAIAGEGEDNKLTRMVKRADSASVATDMRDHGGDASRSAAIGVPVASLILDAIKRLILAKVWELNRPGSPIWISTEGVFIKWADACPEAVKDVLASGMKGIPRSAESLAAILIDHGIAKPDSSGDMYWSIAIHMLRKRDFDETKKDIWLRCLHIPDLHHIFSFEQKPAPVSISVKSANGVVDYVIEKNTVERPAKHETTPETTKKENQLSGDEETSSVRVPAEKLAANEKRPSKEKITTPHEPQKKRGEGRPAPAHNLDEVRAALGLSTKDKNQSKDAEPIAATESTSADDSLSMNQLDQLDQLDTSENEAEGETPSIEDMLVAMDLLSVKKPQLIDTPPVKKDLLKEALTATAPTPVQTELLPVELNTPLEPTVIEEAASISQEKPGTFKLSEHAMTRAQAEFGKLTTVVQEKVRSLFIDCSELRKYTPEMRVEIPVEEDRFSESELHEFVDSGLVFKSPIEGYTGLAYKFRKHWVCLSFDAAFLMSTYDEAFIPFDVEIPDVERMTLKRIVQKYCLPEVDASNRSFYNLNKKAQLDIAQHLAISPVELLNIFRVNFGSVRPSSSRATEIVFFGE